MTGDGTDIHYCCVRKGLNDKKMGLLSVRVNVWQRNEKKDGAYHHHYYGQASLLAQTFENWRWLILKHITILNISINRHNLHWQLLTILSEIDHSEHCAMSPENSYDPSQQEGMKASWCNKNSLYITGPLDKIMLWFFICEKNSREANWPSLNEFYQD